MRHASFWSGFPLLVLTPHAVHGSERIHYQNQKTGYQRSTVCKVWKERTLTSFSSQQHICQHTQHDLWSLPELACSIYADVPLQSKRKPPCRQSGQSGKIDYLDHYLTTIFSNTTIPGEASVHAAFRELLE